MVFITHKVLNQLHSDTIACVLYELLVNLELINVGFQTHDQGSTSFSFVQFSRSCCAVASSVTACILYIRNAWLSRGFLKVFWRSFLQKTYTGCYEALFAACPPRDSLLIIAMCMTIVKGCFWFFWQILRGIFGQGACWGFAAHWPQVVVSGRLRAGHARPLPFGRLQKLLNDL